MKKDYTVSALRIFSMTFIVLCHVVKFYPYIPGHQYLSEVFNVGVQVFLLISGFLYGNKSVNNFKKWYFGRLKKLVVPVSLVAAIDIIILYCVGHRTDIITIFVYLFNLQGLLFLNWSFFSKFITEITNLGPLWFSTIIMLCYLLIPVLQKIREKFKNKLINKKYTSLILGGGGSIYPVSNIDKYDRNKRFRLFCDIYYRIFSCSSGVQGEQHKFQNGCAI